MNWKMLAPILLLMTLVGTVHALSLANLDFGDVNPGGHYNQTLVLDSAPGDIDNYFVVQVTGDMKDWITVSPKAFKLSHGTSQPLDVTITVPKDASLGGTTAAIIAVGQQTVASGTTSTGSTVGYAVAAKSNVAATVVKAGATADIGITSVDAPSDFSTGDIVKFTIAAHNAGNVPATGQFSINISCDGKPVTTIPGAPVDFGLNAQQTTKIFWDTQGQSATTCTALVSVVPSSTGSVKIVPESYAPITLHMSKKAPLSPIIGIISVLLIIVLRRKTPL